MLFFQATRFFFIERVLPRILTSEIFDGRDGCWLRGFFPAGQLGKGRNKKTKL